MEIMNNDDVTSPSIPILRSPPNLMTLGPNGGNLASQSLPLHPVDHLQRQSSSHNLDLVAIRRIYGSALAMHLTTERQHAARVGGRLPGLGTDSRAMLESVTGEDMTIDFGDYLNLRQNRPELNEFGGGREKGPHELMEHKLRL
mmetsp:Transcript_27570/g.33484  ORF Transcript_27570/g.33484 Transcript_27570/m.33484 type:complete len:144 (+) Transcript_27570:155-586(+)|eukprot:CAMPEP_0172494516 /NCGR_PEP_ID=MMETSP1066-20121228/50617_1 /TAXON_ID=671091 /ORGANISM="Coscinodiscus wailesii, Strain CCMP2513" /LENGTH=143 /DNA_ID=CAMNT_0013265563 /DNA_START=154 /DNA_END=585 /DNA_ORIENTATION=-